MSNSSADETDKLRIFCNHSRFAAPNQQSAPARTNMCQPRPGSPKTRFLLDYPRENKIMGACAFV